jgi:hypothetical protein
MNSYKENINTFERCSHLLAATLFCALFFAQTMDAQTSNPHASARQPFVRPSTVDPLKAPDEKNTSKAGLSIPRGTILPVRLNSSLSSSKAKPGQMISATVMQDVPLQNGDKIPRGSKILGHILDRNAATTSSRATISFQFDKLVASHQTIPVTTNLRAIAGFMEVLAAQTPPIGPGESDVFRWLTTVQIGGDVVYGAGGPVTRGDDPSQVVGKSVDHGVLSRISAKEGTKCRGDVYGNDSPQALWVFSSDACGVYGIAHLEISHAGRTSPEGLIVVSSADGSVNVRSGAGLLLRVDEVGQ